MQNFKEKLIKWDQNITSFSKSSSMFASQVAIFIIYFWFGALKVFSEKGAANPLVVALLDKTMPWFPPNEFLICFGIFEIIIGILFILPKMERIAILAMVVHLSTTIMPLVLLPQFTWQSFLVPTLEGQYIIKNILLIVLALNIWSNLRPRNK